MVVAPAAFVRTAPSKGLAPSWAVIVKPAPSTVNPSGTSRGTVVSQSAVRVKVVPAGVPCTHVRDRRRAGGAGRKHDPHTPGDDRHSGDSSEDPHDNSFRLLWPRMTWAKLAVNTSGEERDARPTAGAAATHRRLFHAPANGARSCADRRSGTAPAYRRSARLELDCGPNPHFRPAGRLSRAMRTLQRLIIPGLDVCPEVEMYLRLSGPATLDVEDRQVLLRKGGVVRTDTFFGVFSLGRWGKESTVERISLALDISGSFTVETLVTDLDSRERTVDRRQIGPDARKLAVPALGELGEGMLWFRLTCESDEGRVRAFEITTDDEPSRDVHLGVAITTFNRMPYVAANVARLAQLFKAHPDTAEDVSVLIVDNARNLELPLRGGVPVEIVPNPNLGGAGGFARGLWEHRRRGQATHVLFMDDDIAFEPEVIARTVSYLRFATDPETCVAGSMMRMDRPFVQFEAGADLDPAARNLWEARGRQQNLLYTEVLLNNERLEPFDYGAWWFYAFPLTTDRRLPPAAVRARRRRLLGVAPRQGQVDRHQRHRCLARRLRPQERAGFGLLRESQRADPHGTRLSRLHRCRAAQACRRARVSFGVLVPLRLGASGARWRRGLPRRSPGLDGRRPKRRATIGFGRCTAAR